jgi:tRNA threonylcarbamoyl adenosine modification protein YeaZ
MLEAALPLRILALETSSSRGSVALLDGTTLVASREHHTPKAHAELLLPMIDGVLADAGVSRKSLTRIAVGVGPGSFVGLRVGIALAEGLALGLGCAAIGVPSLHAMTRAVPRERPGTRVAVADARRAEVFLCVVRADGQEIGEVRAVSASAVFDELAAIGPDAVIVGAIAEELGLPWPILRGPELDAPHARWIGAIAAELDPELAPARPLYVRGAGATLPNLPPSPFRGSQAKD